MDPQHIFCPNPACSARGVVGQGNVIVHSRQEQRFRCRTCGQTFTVTKGTALYRLRTDAEVVCLVVTLLAHGCPVQAIVAAFEVDERTVRSWQQRSGQQCQNVHQHLVQGQARDLGQVQADEIRVKIQGGVVWLALAMMVSTRLWLAGALSPSRDFDLVSAVAQQVRQCALCRPLLLCVDGFSAYVRAFREAFRTPCPTKHRGRPRLVAWPDIYIGQVIKHRVGRQVMQITRRIVQGSAAHVQRVLAASQGDGVLNVAYIERLNATFRQRLAALSRRGRAIVRGPVPLQASMYLMGTVYNFCTFHKSLRVALWLPGNRKHWVLRTPVMAAGISDHRWTVRELLAFRVPPPPWVAPKRRGRPPKSTHQAVDPPKRRGRPPKPHSQAVKI